MRKKGGGDGRSGRDGSGTFGGLRPHLPSVLVLVGGLGLTVVLAWATWDSANHDNRDLLRLQTRQAAAAVAAALPSVQTQLTDAMTVATATGSPETFTRFVEKRGLPPAVVSETLWEQLPSGAEEVAEVGERPLLGTTAGTGSAGTFFAHVRSGTRLSVTSILHGRSRRIGYALASKGNPTYIVYAENALPSNSRLRVAPSSPFGDLNFAVYFGPDQRQSQLIESSVSAPLAGNVASSSVPFGNTFITVVATPRGSLVGWISTALPWIVLVVGALLSCVSAATVEYVGRRRKRAEELQAQLAAAYAQQRSIATELQHALLPSALPEIDGVEIAARYLPGSEGIDVGGDWYDVVTIDQRRIVLIVGDVSGRGIPAATVMASLRFASRALAMEGQSPGLVLSKLAKTLDYENDGHFATVLCISVDLSSGRVEMANAGHLPPIVRQDGRAFVAQTVVFPPIGIQAKDGRYETSCLDLGEEATIVAYTDGLVERRGESLDVGVTRLCERAKSASASVDLMVTELASELTENGTADDAVVIGVRWKM